MMDRLIAVLLLISVLTFSCANTTAPENGTVESKAAVEDQLTEQPEEDTASEAILADASPEKIQQESEQSAAHQQAVPVKAVQRKETPAPASVGQPQPSQAARPSPQIPPSAQVSSPAETSPPSPPAETGVQTSTEKVPASSSNKPDHSLWDALLQRYVSASGKVNYAGIKKDQAKLQDYLDELAAHPVQNDWSRNAKMAYWINAYNAFTVKLIVDNFPVSSITKLHGGKPWDVKWIKLGDKTYSLNQIEHEILRPQFQDPRIHFAVNCAAQSCPPLLNRAWTADNLNTYLQRQSRSFINNPKYNTITSRKLMLSRIFDWYASDFDDLIAFINRYSDTQVDKGAEIGFFEYDWSLNN